MSSLFVYHQASPEQPYKVLTHLEDIVSTLAEQGVGFERLQATRPISPDATSQDVLSSYRVAVDAVMTERGYAAVDVIHVSAADPQLRASGLDEHHYDQDEVRFFVAGRGLYTLHIGEHVYAVLCEKNDLICVPASTRRWFDIGEHPRLTALRFFRQQPANAMFTGDSIAASCVQLDDV